MDTLERIELIADEGPPEPSKPKRSKHPNRRLARTLLGIAAVLAISAISTVIYDTATGQRVEAGSFDCFAAIMSTGLTAVAVVIDPPAGIAAVLGYIGLGVGVAATDSACANNSGMQAMLRRIYAQKLAAGPWLIGWRCRVWDLRCYPVYNAIRVPG